MPRRRPAIATTGPPSAIARSTRRKAIRANSGRPVSESFALADRAAADAEIVALTHQALREAGLTQMTLRIGDVGILAGLLDALAMPERWRRRLRHQFWRPDAFRAELKRLTTAPDEAARRLPPPLAALDPADPARAEAIVADYLDRNAIELTGVRGLAEITDGVLTAVADARAEPLDPAHASLIEQTIAVTAPASQAIARLAAVTRPAGLDLTALYDGLDRRLGLIKQAGVNLTDATFSGDFGRKFEYYTGFVFELSSADLGRNNPVAGGGRYDGLLEAIGAPRAVPAVGAAIYTERLLSVQAGGAA